MDITDKRHDATVAARHEAEAALGYLSGAIWAESQPRVGSLLGYSLRSLKKAVAALEAAGVTEPKTN